jgi:gamma-glutamyltranspeptidase/glutathione hydrolase
MKKYFLILFVFLSSLLFLHAQDVTSQNGMVASAHRLASEAGIEILKNGGNAVDAALATAFTLAAVEPNASGLGGGGYLVLKMANEEPLFIDYREKASGKAEANVFYKEGKLINDDIRYGGKSIGVPGMIAGLLSLYEKFGEIPLAQVLQPAIEYCEKGFSISDKLAAIILDKYDFISANPDASNIFLTDFLPPSSGSILKNSQLAGSIKQIVRQGKNLFYKGEIAKAIVQTSKKYNGLLTLNDLENYQPVYGKPVKGTYRGFEIYSAAPSSGGGTHLIEFLNIMEGFELSKMKHNSAQYIHAIAEAMKIILKDKAQYMCDPAFGEVPVYKLTDKHYTKKLRDFINLKKARFDYSPINIKNDESGSTTHLSVVDSKRNVIALTQSINLWFASGIVAEGTGILLNNHMADFSAKPDLPNSVEPNKRPVSSIAPTILLKDGKPFLTIGTPGGTRIIGALAQIIINLVDFKMGIDEAIEAPRIHAQGKYLYLEGEIEQLVADELKKLGHHIKYKEIRDPYFGGAQGIMIEIETGNLIGGADSRRDGMAVGY